MVQGRVVFPKGIKRLGPELQLGKRPIGRDGLILRRIGQDERPLVKLLHCHRRRLIPVGHASDDPQAVCEPVKELPQRSRIASGNLVRVAGPSRQFDGVDVALNTVEKRVCDLLRPRQVLHQRVLQVERERPVLLNAGIILSFHPIRMNLTGRILASFFITSA